MYVGTKRSPQKIIALWVLSFGLYGIYWISKNLDEMKENRGKGVSGRAYTLLAIFFPPLAISACWLLPSTVGKMYTENGKFEQINSCWGAMLFLPSVALWLVAGMAMLIVTTGGTQGIAGENLNYVIAGIVFTALAINAYLLYNWLKKIQIQINTFWDEAATGSITTY